jgi:long-subunit acyl-CoA synthetase (AMP-forming)
VALIDYAIWAAGGVTVPVYETSSAEQVDWILGDSTAAAVTSTHEEIIGSVRGRLPGLEQLWMTGGLDALAAGGAQISEEQLEQRRAGRAAADLATIVHTSGTTGRPKGCELTHGNLLADARNAVGALGDRVHAGRPHVAQHGPDPGVHQDRVEDIGEVRSAVADHERDSLRLLAEVHEQVACLLGGPLPGSGAG